MRRNDRKGPLIRPATAGEYACRGPPSEKENTVFDGHPAREGAHGRDGRATEDVPRASLPVLEHGQDGHGTSPDGRTTAEGA